MNIIFWYKAITFFLVFVTACFFARAKAQAEAGIEHDVERVGIRIWLWLSMIGVLNCVFYAFYFPDEVKDIKIETHVCKFCHKTEYTNMKN